jgi:membrane associated rhomboid family serine protease
MIPIGDENPTLRTPYVTYALLAAIWAVWLFAQGAGLEPVRLAASVCDLGMVPAELTRSRPIGDGIPIGNGLACLIDDQRINILTPLTSMFLHGGWGHILGNSLYLWVFGNNVEDSMGRIRFPLFYILCGLAAAAAHVVVAPTSPVPTIGASGAISGVLGAYLVLYPRAHVRMLFFFLIFFKVFRIPAWLVLLWWFATQVLAGLPELMEVNSEVSSGTAFWAHVGGFVAGVALVKLFENDALVEVRKRLGAAREQERALGY